MLPQCRHPFVLAFVFNGEEGCLDSAAGQPNPCRGFTASHEGLQTTFEKARILNNTVFFAEFERFRRRGRGNETVHSGAHLDCPSLNTLFDFDGAHRAQNRAIP